MHRAAIYKLLSLVFLKDQTDELLEMLKQGGIVTAEKVDDLASAFAHLFIGPGGHLAP